MYQGGTQDNGDTPAIANRGAAYDETSPAKFFAELNNADHFVWTNSTCASSDTVADCASTVPTASLINQYGFAFLDYYIKGTAEPILWDIGAGLAQYRHSP
jgi:hypothetical protein